MTSSTRSFILLHRHGHRSPSLNIYQNSGSALKESSLWNHLIVNQSEHSELSNQHPIHSPHHDLIKRIDVQTRPFGCLTGKGKVHMTKIGASLLKRHPLLKGTEIDAQKISVNATNFQRTQASVQALLIGMGVRTSIPVHCRHVDICGMAFYDRIDMTKTRKIIKRVQLTPEFIALESTELIKDARKQLISELPQLASNGPNGAFNYFAAFDYFYCREHHSLPIKQTLHDSRLSNVIERHMANRFRLYFTHKEHIAMFALPLLRDIRHAIDAKTLLTVFSGHDVNILGLLYGLGLSDAFPEGYWPFFGATVMFEVDHDTEQISIWLDLDNKPLASMSKQDFASIMENHQQNII